MTVVDFHRPGPAAPENTKDAATAWVRAELAAGRRPSGPELRAEFPALGSERTCRRIVAEIAAEAANGQPATVSGRPDNRPAASGQPTTMTGHGQAPVTDRPARSASVAGQRPPAGPGRPPANHEVNGHVAAGQPATKTDRPPVTGQAATAPDTGHGRPDGRPAATGQAAPLLVRVISTFAVVAVAAAGAVLSFDHMRTLAESAGETGLRACLLPVSVDGMVLAASMNALSRRRSGKRIDPLTGIALALGVLASIAANMASAEPTAVGRAVAVWPPVALALSFELLLRQIGHGHE